MSNYNGSGPEGAGPMTGRGLGPCGGATVRGERYGRGMGRGMSRGDGLGCGFRAGNGHGLGRGAGWFSVGYDNTTADVKMTSALERKRAFLLDELARTETLLGGRSASEATQPNKEAGK